MRPWILLFASAVVLAIAVDLARAQIAAPESTTEIRKVFELGRHLAEDLEKRDGSINDRAITGYVQGIADRLARAAGASALQIRITRGLDRYACVLPHGALYISGPLFERIESEAELAGLLAHQLGHMRGLHAPTQKQGNIAFTLPVCVLAMPLAPYGWSEARREAERLATSEAVQILKVAGYEPAGVLDLLSKLVYENPTWARAIVPEDLLNLRAVVETDVPPDIGYLTGSSEFMKQHAKLRADLEPTITSAPSLRRH